MATFNGDRFIAEQIESIRQQTMGLWKMIIRDDGSTDNTKNAIRKFCAIDNRIHLLEDDRGCLGPAGNFNRLMKSGQQNHESYIAFADQDDVWHDDKLKVQLKDIADLEEQYGKHIPLLVHSDLEVVNESLCPIHPSFARYQNIRYPETQDIRTLIVQNVAVGNTILINRPLLDLAVPIPAAAYMHDWWLALCAALFGRLSYNPRQLTRYRIHSHNVTGPVGFRRAINPMGGSLLERLKKMNRIFIASLQQANALRERINSRLTDLPEVRNMDALAKVIDEYLTMRQLPFYRRPIQLMKANIRRQTLLLTILLYIQTFNNSLLKKTGGLHKRQSE
jgi:rhamnosyltransferase